jgi:predicted extracellular nuclease
MQRLVILLFCVSFFSATAQQKLTSDKSFVVMSYNVENLYDTINDPAKDDEEFLPEGKNKWTSERYLKKLEQLSKVISTPNEKNLPAVVGFYEIENKKVIQNLAATKKLCKGKYEVVHYDSPDNRGIDVAFMYNKTKFRVLYSKALNVKLPEEPPYPTRDILYVKGIAGKSDTLHFFLNHWPSRRSGAEASEKNRIAAATVLKHTIDSLTKISPAKIICMGDFNDYPTNKSITQTLGADTLYKASTTSGLFNLCYETESKNLGTYNYKGDWGMLDQFIVSYSLLNAKTRLHVHKNAAKILKEIFMLYTNKETQESKPNSTYGGSNYYGGYSDHLPIYMELFR